MASPNPAVERAARRRATGVSLADTALSGVVPAPERAPDRRPVTVLPWWRPPTWLMLGALLTAATALRIPHLWAGYWGDEALSVGIATRPLSAIPRLLRFDGSPPLYYFLLHLWIQMFGSSEAATHSFSLLTACACIPAGWWCAKVLFGRQAAWAAGILMSVSPYLTTYGTETRMYALLALWGLLAVTCFVRVLLGAGRWYLAGAVGASLLAVYTHNWGLYLMGILTLAGLVAALRIRTLRRPVAVYLVAVSVGYLPWVPSFLHQLGYTGAPWAPQPTFSQLWGEPLRMSASAWWPALLAAALLGVAGVLWTERGLLRTGRGLIWKGRGLIWKGQRSGRTGPVPAGQRGAALASAGALCAGVVLAGWTGGQLVRSWAPRYLGVAVVPALVVLSGLLVRSRVGRLGFGALSVVLAGSGVAGLTVPTSHMENAKSNAVSSVGGFSSSLQPGDVVISTQVSQLPLVAFYAPRGRGLRYATPLGRANDPSVVNWTDLQARLSAADPEVALAPLLAALPVGGHVLLVESATARVTPGLDAYARAVALKGMATAQAVIDDPQLAVIAVRGTPPGVRPANPVTAVLMVKTSAGG